MNNRYKFFITILFSGLFLSFIGKNPNGQIIGKGFPVYLSFSKTVPDSIQDFFKAYLRAKKIEIIEYQQTIELSMTAIHEKVMEKIRSGESMDENKMKNLAITSITPVYNNFYISVYQNQQPQDQKIDSILWSVRALPTKDTVSKTHITYIPTPENQGNIFLQCRAFADTILKKGLLN